MSDNKQLFTCKIKRISEEGDQRYIEGVVYAPMEIDTWGEFMDVKDVQMLAHRFMEEVHMAAAIDTQHNNTPNGTKPVQSFIAVKDDPRGYPENSWVLGCVVSDDILWDKVKRGDISGFSFEAWVTKVPAVITIEYYPQVVGETEDTLDHKHFYVVDLNDKGKVVRGWTSAAADGHTHSIVAGTATEVTNDHSHRFFL